MKEVAKGNVAIFAKETGINDKTLYTYLKGRPPSTEALFYIYRRYRVNINWLLAGDGPIYIIGEEKKEDDADADPAVADLVADTRRILESGNTVAIDTLQRNIRYFDQAIRQEKEMATQTRLLTDQKATLKNMEKRLAALEQTKTPEKATAEDPSFGKKAI